MLHDDETMTREILDFLMRAESAHVRDAYRHIASKYGDALRIQTALRARFPELDARFAAAVAAQEELRARAARRVHLHPDSLYTRGALEQSSSGGAAALHAALFSAESRIVDLCAGIGCDAAALAARAAALVCIEADRITARMLRHNLLLLGCTNTLVLSGTAEQWIPSVDLRRIDGIFADPSRRMDASRRLDGVRRIDPEDASPPLSFIRSLAERVPVTIVKIAPAADNRDAFWQRMFVAVDDECTEQLLIHGLDLPPVSAVNARTLECWSPVEPHGRPLIPPRAAAPMHAAQRTDAAQSTSDARRDTQTPPDAFRTSPQSARSATMNDILRDVRWIIEPHGAIIRTGSVDVYLAQFGCAPIDPQIAYGWSMDEPATGSWHVRYRVIEAMKWERRRVRDALRRNEFGPATTIKKRGFRLDADEARRLLEFPGTRTGVLILTRIGNDHLALLCTRE